MNLKIILICLLFISFTKSIYFKLIDEKTDSKSLMHNYYVKLLMNNTIIKLKPTFNSYYVLINSSSYDFLNSSTYIKLNDEKKEINISNNLLYGYESTDFFQIANYRTTNYTNFPFLLVTENKINNYDNYYPSFMGLAPGKNLKMNFMKYLNNPNLSEYKYFEWDSFSLRIGCYGYRNIISLKPLNLNSLEYEFYKIDFGNIFSSIKLPNKVTFTIDTNYCILPYKYFNQVKKIINEKYFNSNFCYEEIDDKIKYYHYIVCNKKYFESYTLNKKKGLRFFPLSSNSHLFILYNENDIYEYKGNGSTYLKIIFDDRENIFDGWILGKSFLYIKIEIETGNLIYDYELLKNEINDLFEIIFISICIIITIIIFLICYKCDRQSKHKILKYCEILLIFFYVLYFILISKFTCREGLHELFDFPFTFLILLPGFICIFLKVYNRCNINKRNKHIILTRIIYLVLYLGSIIGVRIFSHIEYKFYAIVYTWSLVIYFILDNGFDIYLALKFKNENNEYLFPK